MSNIMDAVQMVSYSGILIQVMTTRCKLTFFTRLCRLRLGMTFCKHGLQSYNILFAFCNFHNPFLYHFMLIKLCSLRINFQRVDYFNVS